MIHEAETALFFARILEAKYNRFQGNLKEALQILQLALDDDSSKAKNEKKDDIYPIMVEICLELGDLEKARSLFEVLPPLEEGQDKNSRFYHQFLHVCLLALEENFDLAHSGLEEIKEIASIQKPDLREKILLQLASARLASAEKRWEDAFFHYKAVVSDFQRYQMIWYQAYFLAEWAGVYLARGSSEDQEQSRGIFKQARDIFAQLEIPYYTSQIDEWLIQA
jgi:tetratricopeptide (TPR) repeat protein